MIINDPHRLAFVHIPKCGGSSVRKALETIDSHRQLFIGRRSPDDSDCLRDFGHFTLEELRDLFPGFFRKVDSYRSYAIVRPPLQRFYSATWQHVFRYVMEGDGRRVTGRAFLQHMDRIAGQLGEPGLCHQPAYVYFTRQVDYVRLDRLPVVKNIFALDRLSECVAEISSLSNGQCRLGRSRKISYIAKGPRWMPGLPGVSKTRLEQALPGIGISPTLEARIADHYAADQALYDEVAAAGGILRLAADGLADAAA